MYGIKQGLRRPHPQVNELPKWAADLGGDDGLDTK